ncbi:MAG TPA: hypothetical protein VFA77_05825 [Candidatus Eisenbacteria bacterium]|jgi:hypothetical protein|nr:hypothetical protein [Candidatus Eisenbacteria bacterium]
MRSRTILIVSLALNGALAIALITTGQHSTVNQPEFIITNFQASLDKPSDKAPTNSAKNTTESTNPAVASAQSTPDGTNDNSIVRTDDAKNKPRPRGKTFTWQDVESEDYQGYLVNLREAGCPEAAIRNIILNDVNELFTHKRMKEAIACDQQWWRAEYDFMALQLFQQKTQALQEERRALVTKLLGENVEDKEQYELAGRTPMTGPVLGKLSPQTHNAVQEVCDRAMERHQAYIDSVTSGAKPLSQIELARLREQTRNDLSQILNTDEMEEFLLRYSHNAHNLRFELRVFEPTPEEFRKVFRATDSLLHKTQLDYGDEQALSLKQKEQVEQQRLAAIKELLTPERYQAFLQKRQTGYRPTL